VKTVSDGKYEASVLVTAFSYFFCSSAPCAILSWLSVWSYRAHVHISYRIVSYRVSHVDALRWVAGIYEPVRQSSYAVLVVAFVLHALERVLGVGPDARLPVAHRRVLVDEH